MPIYLWLGWVFWFVDLFWWWLLLFLIFLTKATNFPCSLLSAVLCNSVQTDQALGSRKANFVVLPSLTEAVVFIWHACSIQTFHAKLPSETPYRL